MNIYLVIGPREMSARMSRLAKQPTTIGGTQLMLQIFTYEIAMGCPAEMSPTPNQSECVTDDNQQ